MPILIRQPIPDPYPFPPKVMSDPDRHRHDADPQHRNNNLFPGKHATLIHTIHAVPSKVRKDKQQPTAGVQKIIRKNNRKTPCTVQCYRLLCIKKHVAGPNHRQEDLDPAI
jgi:hypothetical protein